MFDMQTFALGFLAGILTILILLALAERPVRKQRKATLGKIRRQFKYDGTIKRFRKTQNGGRKKETT